MFAFWSRCRWFIDSLLYFQGCQFSISARSQLQNVMERHDTSCSGLKHGTSRHWAVCAILAFLQLEDHAFINLNEEQARPVRANVHRRRWVLRRNWRGGGDCSLSRAPGVACAFGRTQRSPWRVECPIVACWGPLCSQCFAALGRTQWSPWRVDLRTPTDLRQGSPLMGDRQILTF